MKRILIALILIGGIAAVAFATLSGSAKKKEKQEIKKDQKEKKKECKHVCPFS